MRITESTLRRIVREEIVGQAVREGRMSLREGRRLMEGGATMTGNDIIQKLKDAGEDREAARIADSTHIRKNPNAYFEVNRQGTGDIAFYTADGKTFIESIPAAVAKKADIRP